MTKKEMCDILNLLKSAYPLFYSNAKAETMDRVIDVWYEMLGGYDFGTTSRAIKNMIIAEAQIPTIALVTTYITKQRAKDEERERQANAWREAGFGSEREYLEKISELRR